MSMTLVPEAIESYAAEHSEPESALFEQLRKETYASMGSPQMQVGRLEGHFLRLLVRLCGARRALLWSILANGASYGLGALLQTYVDLF